MSDITAALGGYWKDLGWWFRRRVATFPIRHWGAILWVAFFLTCILLLGTIALFVPEWNAIDKIQYIGFGLAMVFGLFTLISLSVTLTNLPFEVVPDYPYAGSAFEKVIRSTTRKLYVLAESPAFLEVLDPVALAKWLNTLERQMTRRQH